MSTKLLIILGALLALSLPASGTTYTIRPDGTGDFPTITGAIDLAEDGDVIELTDGVFTGTGNRDIDFGGRAIAVRSQSGNAESCIIDCEGGPGNPHRGFIFQTGEGTGSVVEGITIRHGWAEAYGGGVYCADDVSPTFIDCIFSKNESAYGGGMRGGSSSVLTRCAFVENTAVRGGGIGRGPCLELNNCSFERNSATYGGGIYIRSNCSPTLICCMFEDNTAAHSGGGMHIEQHCSPLLGACTFVGNTAPIGAAIDISIECSPRIANCTIVENTCTYSGAVSVFEYCTPRLENTIIAFNATGQAVTAYDGGVKLVCCDVYGNGGGDWVGTIADQLGLEGNISEDPLFCGDEYPQEPYTLHWYSPCSPETNPACGFIGAWDLRCGFVPVEEMSWGALKALYRTQ